MDSVEPLTDGEPVHDVVGRISWGLYLIGIELSVKEKLTLADARWKAVLLLEDGEAAYKVWHMAGSVGERSRYDA